jgi:hypothetical protein
MLILAKNPGRGTVAPTDLNPSAAGGPTRPYSEER